MMNPDKVMLVVDNSLKEHPLISIGLMRLLGFSFFTYPNQLRKFDRFANEYCDPNNALAPHTWIHTNEVIKRAIAGDRIAIISDNEFENIAHGYSISNILHPLLENCSPSSFCLIVDTLSYRFRGELRPLREEEWVYPINYQILYEKTSKWFAEKGYAFPLIDSRAVFFQIEALRYEIVTGEKITSIFSFFQSLPKAPYLQLWKQLGVLLGFGLDIPTCDTRKIAEYISRYIEVDSSTSYLHEFCERLFDDYCRMLYPAYLKNETREMWPNAKKGLDTIEAICKRYSKMVNEKWK